MNLLVPADLFSICCPEKKIRLVYYSSRSLENTNRRMIDVVLASKEHFLLKPLISGILPG